MTRGDGDGLRSSLSLFFDVLQSQSKGVIGLLVIFASVVTYIAAGLWGILVLAGVILVGVIGAQHQYIRTHHREPHEESFDGETSGSERDRDADTEGEQALPPDSGDQEEAEPAVEDLTEDESQSDDDFMAALDAAVERDAAAARTHLDAWIEQSDSESDRLERRALREFVLIRAGDSAAIHRLRSLADENPSNRYVVTQLAQALEASGAVQSAANELRSRSQQFENAEDRIRLGLEEARIRLKIGDLPAVEDLCQDALECNEPKIAARGHELLGDAHLERDNTTWALGHWVASLQLDPTNSDLRFQLGYHASKSNLPDLSIHSYLVLHRNGAASSTAYNNLGSTLRRRGGKGLGTDYWRRASEQGSALAAGNIANALASSGFLEEAEDWIERGRDLDDESPRLGEAAQAISNQRREDNDLLSELEANGRRIEEFFLLLSERQPQTDLPTGEWQFSDGHSYSFSVDPDSATECVIGSSVRNDDRKLTLKRTGDGIDAELDPSKYRDSAHGTAVVRQRSVDILFPKSDNDALLLTGEPAH